MSPEVEGISAHVQEIVRDRRICLPSEAPGVAKALLSIAKDQEKQEAEYNFLSLRDGLTDLASYKVYGEGYMPSYSVFTDFVGQEVRKAFEAPVKYRWYFPRFLVFVCKPPAPSLAASSKPTERVVMGGLGYSDAIPPINLALRNIFSKNTLCAEDLRGKVTVMDNFIITSIEAEWAHSGIHNISVKSRLDKRREFLDKALAKIRVDAELTNEEELFIKRCLK